MRKRRRRGLAGVPAPVAIGLVALAPVALGCTSPSRMVDPSGGGDGGNGSAPATGGRGGDGPAAEGGGESGWERPPPDYCSLCRMASGSPVQNASLVEASGLAASEDHPGVFYAANDSGDSARFFAIGSDGSDLGSYLLEAATADDYEDLAMGPCALGKCIFIADVGDNDEVRSYVVIYRAPEPAALGPGSHQAHPNAFKIAYEDGPHNSETFLIHPLTGEMVLVTAAGSGATSLLYRLPGDLVPNLLVTATLAGQLNEAQGSSAITGGDVHPLAHGVLLRTFTHVWYYALASPRESIVDALQRPPCALPVQREPQGESIAWTQPGDGYATLSEGVSSPLNLYACGPR
jgi:hypothetical protein